jgi:peptidoglycan/xylan/chitin deacetylase (PgdA/CDA1 family)
MGILANFSNSERFKKKVKLAVRIVKPFSISPPTSVFFLFHTVEETQTPWTHGHRYITPFPIFKKQIAFIKEHFEVVPTSVLVQKLQDGDLERSSAAIHFDDGFSSYADLALPFLREKNISSTVFLINSVVDGGVPIRNKIAFCINMGEEKHLKSLIQSCTSEDIDSPVCLAEMQTTQLLAWIKGNITSEMEYIINEVFQSCIKRHNETSPFMDERVVRKLNDDSYVEIGSHTVNHPMLSMLDEREQRAEIIGGHIKLEEYLGRKLKYFAYPHGGKAHFDETSRSIIKESNRLTSFSSYGGLNYKLDNTDVKRITLSDHTALNIKFSVLKHLV